MMEPATDTMTCGQRLLRQLAVSESARQARAAAGSAGARDQHGVSRVQPKHARGHLSTFDNSQALVQRLPQEPPVDTQVC